MIHNADRPAEEDLGPVPCTTIIIPVSRPQLAFFDVTNLAYSSLSKTLLTRHLNLGSSPHVSIFRNVEKNKQHLTNWQRIQ